MQKAAELFASSLLFFTVGCGASFVPAATDTSSTTGVALQGTVFGGRQPISGAHIYLMTATTAANAVTTTPTYGSPSTSILTAGAGTDSMGTYVTTNASGSFTITGDYTCTGGALTYIVAVGGNPGDGVNSAAVLVDLLGPCPGTAGSTGNTLGSSTSIQISELTTVAAAYALAPFATDALHVGAPTTNVAGITAAFASAAQLVSPNYGNIYTTTPAISGYSTASGLSGNGTVPANKIALLGNILASCVNTSGPTSHNCAVLFANTNSASQDIFSAALSLARNPAVANVALPTSLYPANSFATTTNLFNLVPTTPPYSTTISTAPKDFTLAITFTAPNTSTPTRAAVDASGNLWFPNYGNSTLTEMSPAGAVLSGTAGFTSGTMGHPWAVGIKPTTNEVFAANATSNYISVFNASGSSTGQFGTLLGANITFYSLAFNKDGTTYMGTNLGAYSISVLGEIYNVFGTSTMYTSALNSSGVLNSISNAGNTLMNASNTFSGGGLSAPTGIATDHSGNFWITNNNSAVLSEFTSAGVPVSSTGYTGGGLNTSWGVAVDGDGKVFVSNGNGSLSEFTSTGVAMSPSVGYATGSTAGIYSAVLDNAGNLWAPATDGKIYKYIGLAAPVSLPLVNNTVGVRP